MIEMAVRGEPLPAASPSTIEIVKKNGAQN
jgi:hypothetical protein